MDPRSTDHTLVRRLLVRVGDRLEERLSALARQRLPAMSDEDVDVLKAELAREVVDDYGAAQAEEGTPLAWETTQDLVTSLKNRLYGAGSFESLLRDESIEDINMLGWDKVFVDYADGTHKTVQPVFSSNEELIEAIQTLAAHEGLSGRAFDVANPLANFRVGSARFQAIMAVSTVPHVSIRLHPPTRLLRLKDLVANGTIDEPLMNFLSAMVRAKKNAIIGGETGAGKTLLLRALAAEIDPRERIVTIERALELGLEDDAEAHENVVALEERTENAEGEGAVPMRELVTVSKRIRPDRVFVGEVLGPEILAMMDAMRQGNDGSLSTIHANSSRGIEENIYSYAVQAPEGLPRAATASLMATSLNFLVFVKRYRDDNGQRRVVQSVREIVGNDETGLKTNEIFKPGRDGMAERDRPVAINCIEELRAVGYRDVGEEWV